MNVSITDYFNHRLERLKANIKILEESVADRESDYIADNKKFADLIEQKEGRLSEVEQVNLDFINDDIALIDESKQFYRQSSFLLLYAFLEDGLNKICQLANAQFKYNLSPNDLCGSGVFKYKNYIEKVMRIKISEEIWMSLNEYRQIRNQLAHEFGEIDNDSHRKEVNKIVNKNKNLSLDDWGFTGFIRMKIEFLYQVIADIESLFYAIDKEIDSALKVRIVK